MDFAQADQLVEIYIPLCIYFNAGAGAYQQQPPHIYIPLCIYFNQNHFQKYEMCHIYLHSTMYLFQLVLFRALAPVSRYLHSTMYLFQHQLNYSVIALGINLHSTMYLFQPETSTFLVIFLTLFTFHYVSISTPKQRQTRKKSE